MSGGVRRGAEGTLSWREETVMLVGGWENRFDQSALVHLITRYVKTNHGNLSNTHLPRMLRTHHNLYPSSSICQLNVCPAEDLHAKTLVHASGKRH